MLLIATLADSDWSPAQTAPQAPTVLDRIRHGNPGPLCPTVRCHAGSGSCRRHLEPAQPGVPTILRRRRVATPCGNLDPSARLLRPGRQHHVRRACRSGRLHGVPHCLHRDGRRVAGTTRAHRSSAGPSAGATRRGNSGPPGQRTTRTARQFWTPLAYCSLPRWIRLMPGHLEPARTARQFWTSALLLAAGSGSWQRYVASVFATCEAIRADGGLADNAPGARPAIAARFSWPRAAGATRRGNSGPLRPAARCHA